MRRIGGILGRSPIGPLREHMLKAQDCARLLDPILAAFIAQDFDEVQSLSARIFRLEEEADAIKTEIRAKLSSSIFSAVEHGEVIALLKKQDDIADGCQDAARLLEVRRTVVTAGVAEALRPLDATVLQTVGALVEITALAQAQEPNAAARVREQYEALHRARESGSDLAHRALKEVFAEEEELGPVSVVLLMQLIRTLSGINHSAENAADALMRLASGK